MIKLIILFIIVIIIIIVIFFLFIYFFFGGGYFGFLAPNAPKIKFFKFYENCVVSTIFMGELVVCLV